MKSYGDLDFQSANSVNDVKVRLAIETDFPQSPLAGRILFVNKRVMICVDIVAGVPVWVPLTNELDAYIHTQTSASTTWTINHGLNNNNVFIQVMTAAGHTVFPDDIDLSVTNVATVTFNQAITGRAIAMLGSLSGTPKDNVVYQQSYTNQQVWTVAHGLGYYPVIRVYIGGYQVQPVSIVNDSLTSATVTFSSAESGFVNCI